MNYPIDPSSAVASRISFRLAARLWGRRPPTWLTSFGAWLRATGWSRPVRRWALYRRVARATVALLAFNALPASAQFPTAPLPAQSQPPVSVASVSAAEQQSRGPAVPSAPVPDNSGGFGAGGLDGTGVGGGGWSRLPRGGRVSRSGGFKTTTPV